MHKRKVVFLILPKVHMLDLAGPVQVFQEAIVYDRERRSTRMRTSFVKW